MRVTSFVMLALLAGCAGPASFADLPARPYEPVGGERRSLANATVELGEDAFVVDLVGSRVVMEQVLVARATRTAGSEWRVGFASVVVSGGGGSGALRGEARVEDGVLVADVPFAPSEEDGILPMRAEFRMPTRHGAAPGEDAVFVVPFVMTSG